MPFALIPFLLLIVPVVEIAAFIMIGGQIGLWATLLMILVTAIIGTILLRRQGIALLTQIRSEMDAGRLPARELADGAMLLVAGILLLTPGFVTDGIGFSLFLPPVRGAIRHFIASRVRVVGPGGVEMGPDMFRQQQARRDGFSPDGAPVVDLDADEYERRPQQEDDAPPQR